VEARPAGKPAGPAIRVTSDPQGRFFIRLPVGDYALAAQAKDHAPQVISAVRAVGHPEPVEFRLAPRAASADVGSGLPSRAAAGRSQ